jgi:hypothetical protein
MGKTKEYDIYTADYIKGVVPHYERFVKLSVAEELVRRVKELEDALNKIADNSFECGCCSASLFAEQALKITKGR